MSSTSKGWPLSSLDRIKKEVSEGFEKALPLLLREMLRRQEEIEDHQKILVDFFKNIPQESSSIISSLKKIQKFEETSYRGDWAKPRIFLHEYEKMGAFRCRCHEKMGRASPPGIGVPKTKVQNLEVSQNAFYPSPRQGYRVVSNSTMLGFGPVKYISNGIIGRIVFCEVCLNGVREGMLFISRLESSKRIMKVLYIPPFREQEIPRYLLINQKTGRQSRMLHHYLAENFLLHRDQGGWPHVVF